MPNLDKQLSDMAVKLGSKAEQLWPILVANERLEWIMAAVLAALILAAGCLTAFAIRMGWIEEDWMPGGAILLALGFIILLAVIFTAPAHFIHPEIGVARSLLGR